MVPRRIGFLGFDGVTACHLVAPADTLAAAALDDGYGNRIPCYQICTIGLSSEKFRAESGVIFKAHETLHTAPDLDTIVIPGGEGLRRNSVSEKISDWILTRANQTRRIAAICTGIYGLAPTGLLDGREVTTHSQFASDVARHFPSLRLDYRRPLVRDGPFYTSSDLHAAIDLSLAFVEEDYGRRVALATSQKVMLPVNGNGYSELSKPLSFNSQPADRFAELIPWIMRNLHADLTVNALAGRVCMSPRHFNRAFKSVFGDTPSEFVEKLRVNEAKRRLSVQKRTVDAIAVSVGFSNAQAFRRACERRFAARPGRYLTNSNPSSPIIPLTIQKGAAPIAGGLKHSKSAVNFDQSTSPA